MFVYKKKKLPKKQITLLYLSRPILQHYTTLNSSHYTHTPPFTQVRHGLNHVWMTNEHLQPLAHISMTDVMVMLMRWVPPPNKKQSLYLWRWKLLYLMILFLVAGALVAFIFNEEVIGIILLAILGTK